MIHPAVSVVVLNWDGKEVIGACLHSLDEQTYKPHEVIVVENGSTDGSIEYIQKNFSDATLLLQPKNLGFAGGVNVGIRAAKGEYVFLLNNDAVADRDCIKHLVATAESEKADIVSAVILTDNDTKIDSDGDVYTTWGLPFPANRGLSPSHLEDGEKEIFAASGGASLYKKSLFDEIGLFDEMFFAYYEDVDLSMRAQLVNKSIWLSPKSIVHHAMSHTSDKLPGFGREMAIRNSIYLFYKNVPSPLWLKMLPRFWYSNTRLTVAAIVKGHPVRAIRAQLVALVHFPKVLILRHKIQSTKKITSKEFEAMLVNVSNFAVNKARK